MLPDTRPTAADSEAVSEIIRRVAAEEILTRFNKLKDHAIGGKASGEIVTDADIIGERRLTEELTRLLPGSVVVGEEAFADDPGIVAHFENDAPVWVLDPLDGTRNFSKGRPCFCVIVALCVGKDILGGWIYEPLNDEFTTAIKGQGASNGAGPVSLTAAPGLKDMTGSLGKRRRERISERDQGRGQSSVGEMLRYRCIGMEYVDMVKGKIHFAEYGNLKSWDHAAGVLIHREAGGRSCFVADGRDYVPGPIASERFICAPDPTSWQQVHDFLAEETQSNPNNR